MLLQALTQFTTKRIIGPNSSHWLHSPFTRSALTWARRRNRPKAEGLGSDPTQASPPRAAKPCPLPIPGEDCLWARAWIYLYNTLTSAQIPGEGGRSCCKDSREEEDMDEQAFPTVFFWPFSNVWHRNWERPASQSSYEQKGGQAKSKQACL